MPDFDFAPLVAQVPIDVLLDEIKRRVLLTPNGDGSALATAMASAAMSSTSRENGPPGQIRSDEFFRLSIPEAIKKYLNIMKRPQQPKPIVEGLRQGGVLSSAKNFYANVWGELKRMEERDVLVNTPSGWAIAEWYPALKKGAEPKQKRKPKGDGVRAKRPRRSATTKPKPLARSASKAALMTYPQFLGQYVKSGKPKPLVGEAWRQYKVAHGLTDHG